MLYVSQKTVAWLFALFLVKIVYSREARIRTCFALQLPNMKVLITTGVYPPEIGGPATYTWLLERELPKHDVVVDVLPFRDVRHLPKGLRHVAFAWKTFVRALHADVVIAQDTLSTALPVMIGAMLAMKPLVLRVPGD